MTTNKKQIKKELKKVSKLVSKLSKKKFKKNLDSMVILHEGVSDIKTIVKYVLKSNHSYRLPDLTEGSINDETNLDIVNPVSDTSIK